MKPLDCVGIDPTKAEVGKHDFQPSTTEPIIHGEGKPPMMGLVEELAAVTRERDALAAALERCSKRFVLASSEEGIRVEAVLREFSLRHEHAVDTLSKLARGELRKPAA